MRILQVIDSLSITGGAESLLVDLCLQWKRNGISLEVFALQYGGLAPQARLEGSGVSVTAAPGSGVYSPAHARRLAKVISSKRFDLVHVHLYPAQLWTAIALRSTTGSPPAITTEHNTWNRRREYGWCRPIDRWMYSQFRLAVCIGSATESSLQSWLGPSGCPTCVVANGIDLARFRHPNAPAKLPDAINGAATILCVGSLTDRKSQETLVRAVAEIDGVHILLAGDGPMKRAVQDVARELGVGDRVHFLGIRNDIPELIAAAQLYVQPSRVDGFCLAALEAMAGGLPVVASDIPGLRDVVGDAGVLFPAGDHRLLAECIRRLLSDFALRKKLSDRGIHRAQEFSIDKTAAEYQKIFEAVTERAVVSPQHEFTL